MCDILITTETGPWSEIVMYDILINGGNEPQGRNSDV